MKSGKVVLILMPLALLIGCSEPVSTVSDDASTAVDKLVPSQQRVENKAVSELDLSIDKLPLAEVNESDYSESKHTLPNVFEKNNKEKKTSISGGVLRQEENPDYLDSIQGAKVSVEVKIP